MLFVFDAKAGILAALTIKLTRARDNRRMRLYRVTTQYVERPNGFYVYTKNTAPPLLLCSVFRARVTHPPMGFNTDTRYTHVYLRPIIRVSRVCSPNQGEQINFTFFPILSPSFLKIIAELDESLSPLASKREDFNREKS